MTYENQGFEELLNILLDKALTATDAEIGSSFMVDPVSRRLRLVGAQGLEDLHTGTYINIDDSLIRHVIDGKKTLLVKDVENDPRIQKKNDPKYGSPSFLSVPISMNHKGDVKAVINLSHKKTGESFNADDEKAISTMLVEVRLNLENAFLQSQMAEYIKDIENRNYQLEQEIGVRTQIESSLRESESRFRELADLLPQTVFETDLKGNLLFTNRSAFKFFGYTPTDFDHGLNAFQMFIPEDRDRLRNDTRRIVSGETLGGIEYTALRKDGSTFPVTVYASPIIRLGKLSGIRGLVVDITERKLAEEIQNKLHESLRQAEKMAAVGIFAAGMAHEVKNPLAIIVQGIGYLKSSVLSSDPVSSDILERIKKSAMRADSIVKGLLSFTHQIPIQKEKEKIIPIIEEALSCMEHQLNSNQITVLKQYSADVPMVYIDSSQIKQVFFSILTNSLEAMEAGGTITIRTRETKSASGQQNIQIILSDTGCGISEYEIKKVFDPFYTTKDSCGNAGLGLSISKGIVDKHQGMIRIESTVNQGTHVTIELPANTEHGGFDTFKNMDSHVIASKA